VHAEYAERLQALWAAVHSAAGPGTAGAEPARIPAIATSAPGDRRFAAREWEDLPYFALAGVAQILPIVLAIAAASLLYVAVADLIPSLHRRPEPVETLKQLALIGLGVGVIAAARLVLEH
jgi:hypothetical protein